MPFLAKFRLWVTCFVVSHFFLARYGMPLSSQPDFPGNNFSWFDESAVRSAIDQIKNNPDFFASECLSMVRKAANWGIESAADNDKRKAKFLEGVSQRKGRDFLRHVLEVY